MFCHYFQPYGTYEDFESWNNRRHSDLGAVLFIPFWFGLFYHQNYFGFKKSGSGEGNIPA